MSSVPFVKSKYAKNIEGVNTSLVSLPIQGDTKRKQIDHN